MSEIPYKEIRKILYEESCKIDTNIEDRLEKVPTEDIREMIDNEYKGEWIWNLN